jgi:hypothetical protein
MKKIFIACLLVTALAACKSKSAYTYCKDFLAKEKSLMPDIEKTEANIKTYFAADEFDSIAVAGEKMEKLVDNTIQGIQKEPAPDVKQGAEFKQAGIKYFEFIKSMYTAYKNYGHTPTPDGRDEEMKKLMDIVSHRQDAINDIQNAQKKYADANNIKLDDQLQ